MVHHVVLRRDELDAAAVLVGREGRRVPLLQADDRVRVCVVFVAEEEDVRGRVLGLQAAGLDHFRRVVVRVGRVQRWRPVCSVLRG